MAYSNNHWFVVVHFPVQNDKPLDLKTIRSLFFYLILAIALHTGEMVFAQFDGKAGGIGSRAIFKDSSIFVNWAKTCEVSRGFQNISKPEAGLSSFGSEQNATGKSGTNGVLSLGDGGSATLTFEKPVRNGNGPDFAVFENGFDDQFLELAFVEVSSDGQKFVRFSAISNTQTQTQIGPFDYVGEAEKINNLAGKYRVFYGTPFDLIELQDSIGLDINKITHVRIIDVVGSLDPAFGQKDSKGRLINDPFPTEFPSSGFDLDAVGVIHESITELPKSGLASFFFPNPVSETLNFSNPEGEPGEFFLVNQIGQRITQTTENQLKIGNIKDGIYAAVFISTTGKKTVQKIRKR